MGFISSIIEVFEKFSFNSRDNAGLYRKSYIVFLLIILAIAILFLSRAFNGAQKKVFWMDETFALDTTIKHHNTMDLLIMGAYEGQGSPAPLDYIVVKFLDNIEESVNSFGLHYNIYYRLNSIVSSLMFGIVAVLLPFQFMKKSSSNYLIFILQNIFLIFAFLLFLFWPFNFQYSIEVRPYALWNSLWLVVLVSFIYYKEMKVLFRVFLVLLAATATASVFQMSCFIGAYLFCKMLEREDAEKVVAEVAKTFVLPLIVGFYYIWRKTSVFDYSADHDLYIKQFYNFWTTKEMIPILMILGIIITVKFKEMRNITIIFVTMLFLYLVSPLINYIVLANKFFFSSRQYIYYDLIYPLFFIGLAVSLPQYYSFVKKTYKE